ncbi:hypothetical protein PVK06_025955 [Gossypium arboreum]|uniref:Phosphatidate cytidylyltransferase n=1 Tax=Gossypium arboreum TaxID=29729 RepID=A0ABR0NZ39_GOSAR|nr:hypothetical protein PVK06_025955 [Gossypium arboreum]
MLFVYGRILSHQLVNTVTSDKIFYKLVSKLIKYQMVICYFLYIAGVMWFILTLKKKMYKYQFGQFAWTHMILIVVFTQSAFTVANIFEGIFWFLLPASLIAVNDVAAYFFGFFFGKTPLIKLSPKKTWEGFIGASVVTTISAFVLANVFGHFQWLTCPRKDLSTGWLLCDPGPLFKPEYYPLPGWLSRWVLPWKEVAILPVQWHALCLSLFASSIAPFGGFFASGFKRAFKIKDFGDSIPGHGGFTDRMDCQASNQLYDIFFSEQLYCFIFSCKARFENYFLSVYLFPDGNGCFCIHLSSVICCSPRLYCRDDYKRDITQPYFGGAANSIYQVRSNIAEENG